MKIRRSERRRIRLALREAFDFVKSRSPGAQDHEDEWCQAARILYLRAVRITRAGRILVRAVSGADAAAAAAAARQLRT
jgi:hypothetical protein